MDRNRPLIGVCAYELPVAFGAWRDVDSVVVPSAYTRSVLAAGGIPIVLAPLEDAAGELAELVDGIVLTGGSDIDPALYGQVAGPETVGVVGHRDRAELALVRAADRRGLPLFGICRGMQLLNVARGGTLHQHLGDLGPHAGRHKGPPGTYTRHRVHVHGGTRLAEMLCAAGGDAVARDLDASVTAAAVDEVERLARAARVSSGSRR